MVKCQLYEDKCKKWDFLARFYIFNDERLWEDYTKLCKLRTCIYVNAKEGLDDMCPIQIIIVNLTKVCSK